MKRILCLFSLLLLASCATRQAPSIDTIEQAPEKKTLTYKEREQKINRIRSFVANGAIAVKEDRKGFSASMTWSERSYANYKVDLYGPFGAGHITLRVIPGLATLKDSKNQVQSSNAENLLQKETGHYIPLNYLKYWLKGIPKPNVPSSKKTDKSQKITSMSQAGWHISYLRYKKAFGLMLPAKIRLTRGNLRVKIAIHRWR